VLRADQRNKISRAGHEGLEKRGRSTASAGAHGWAIAFYYEMRFPEARDQAQLRIRVVQQQVSSPLQILQLSDVNVGQMINPYYRTSHNYNRNQAYDYLDLRSTGDFLSQPGQQ
jgi:hypothetical protein